MDLSGARFETLGVHAGCDPDPTTGAVTPPIYMTSTFVQAAPGSHKGYEYSRTGNPTRTALETNLAALEGAPCALAFASGCAAATTAMFLLAAGDHVVAGDDLYGGTYRLFTKGFGRFGVEFTFVDTTDLDAVRRAFRPETRMLWLESPSNPLLKVTDLVAACQIAREREAMAVVDNTFASPFLQRPIQSGADLVLHSTTKYLGGHADLVGGALVAAQPELHERLKFFQNALGGVPSPFDSWLVLRGAKTLAVRMERHSANALALARWLESRGEVERCHYPGLASHPQHELARRQMRAFGGMISFELKGGLERAKAFVSSTRLFRLAESLGGVESLIEMPAAMTHAAVPPEERKKAGLADGLIRLSVGIENVEDLQADLEHAFQHSLARST
ncbi:MAG: cystathionine gamma-synthase [Planctomycetes bacterium]|nr:cystathionine gamma-synthase [Planctomycetota bacterium]